MPTHVQIPAIDVDAAIEPVGLTDRLEMDVPQEWDRVGWYRYGYRPGQPGNAVLAGHLDTNTGAPGIFWRLAELQPGDAILIQASEAEPLVFQVESLVSYPYEQAPMLEISGPAEIPRLNLVTCSGNWSAQEKIYDQRFVVYAQIVEDGIQNDTQSDN